MENLSTNIVEEIRQEVQDLLKKHHIKWINFEIWETSDGFLVEIETPDIKDHMEGIFLSRKLEEELKDPLVTLSILPAE